MIPCSLPGELHAALDAFNTQFFVMQSLTP